MGWSRRTHSPLTFAQQAAADREHQQQLARRGQQHESACDCDACCIALVKERK